MKKLNKYKNKYLKYKNKYIKLKGGSKCYNGKNYNQNHTNPYRDCDDL